MESDIPKSPYITTQSWRFVEPPEAIGAERGLNGREEESDAAGLTIEAGMSQPVCEECKAIAQQLRQAWPETWLSAGPELRQA